MEKINCYYRDCPECLAVQTGKRKFYLEPTSMSNISVFNNRNNSSSSESSDLAEQQQQNFMSLPTQFQDVNSTLSQQSNSADQTIFENHSFRYSIDQQESMSNSSNYSSGGGGGGVPYFNNAGGNFFLKAFLYFT